LLLATFGNYDLCAASSSSSSEAPSDFVPPSYRYYSEHNLNRINHINEELEQLRDDAGNLIKPLRKKHAPIMVLADPCGDDKKLNTFKKELYDIAQSQFAPLLLLNYSLLQTFKNATHPFFFDLKVFTQQYRLFDIPNTQFVILIPHWFLAYYSMDSGLRLESFEEKSDLLSNETACTAWLKAKERSLGTPTEKILISRFVTDLEKTFVLQGPSDIQLPLWDIYFGGHGSSGMHSKPAYLANFPMQEFVKILHFFSEKTTTNLMLVSSCCAGGVNANALNQELNKKTRPLSFHLIIESIGDTETFSGRANLDGSEFLADPRMPRLMEDYFQNAAQLEPIERYPEADQLAQDSFVNILDSLLARLAFAHGSLHGSEYLPQWRLRGNDFFNVLDNDTRFFIIKKDQKNTNLTVPLSAHTVVFCNDTVHNLTISTRNILPSLLSPTPRVQSAFKGTIPSNIFPTWIIIPQGTVLENETIIAINHIELQSPHQSAGICAFLRDSFLTTLIENEVRIKIRTLSGLNDIRHYSKNPSLNAVLNEQQLLTRSSAPAPQITLENVSISKSANLLKVDFTLNDEQYRLTWQYEKKWKILSYTDELFNAIGEGDLLTLQMALARGTPPNTIDPKKRNMTLLHKSCSLKKRIPFARKLVEFGANINAVDSEGRTPLMYAVAAEAPFMVRFLLQKGALTNLIDAHGYTALTEACCTGNKAIIQMLLDKGADFSFPDNTGQTALAHACAANHIDAVKMLLKAGANPNEMNHKGLSLLMEACASDKLDIALALLSNKKTNIDQYSIKAHETALMFACRRDSLTLVKALLAHRANPHIKNRSGDTALDIVKKQRGKNKEQIIRELEQRTNNTHNVLRNHASSSTQNP
jgi:ankyrin repeat protein